MAFKLGSVKHYPSNDKEADIPKHWEVENVTGKCSMKIKDRLSTTYKNFETIIFSCDRQSDISCMSGHIIEMFTRNSCNGSSEGKLGCRS